MINRVFSLIVKETLHILRDPRSLYLALGLPIVLLILFGYAITFDVQKIPLAVVDEDSTQLSRDLIARIEASQYFDIKFVMNNYSNPEKFLDYGKIKIVLVIPSGFSRNLSLGKNTFVQLLIDGSDNNTAQIALSYASGAIQMFSTNIIREKLHEVSPIAVEYIPPVNLEPRIWYNPELRSTNFIVPGLIATVMMILAAMMTSLTIAREWEVGTMEQLIATPARSYEIIIGKLTPYFFLGILQLFLVSATGILLFKVPLKGNIFFLFCISSIFLICGLGMGLYVSTVTKSQQLAFMMSVILTFLPSIFLSGFIFPVSSMPWIIQFFSYFVPAKYFLIILRGIFLKGNGLYVLWPQVLCLIIFASIIIIACTKRLKL
ncbi:MAG: ABC transporter permease, partial [Candidatus Aminicenantes bacterium]|nr:ABC transporter permease [Candidatus Aminicenantes bacterium]